VTPEDEKKLAALKREIALGIDDLENGRFQIFTEANLKRLADEICQSGRRRLKEAKPQQKK
jgi:hypothetical protein